MEVEGCCGSDMVAVQEPLSSTLWMRLSERLHEIRALSRKISRQSRRFVKATAKEALVVCIPFTITIHVATSPTGREFASGQNLVSAFVDSSKLLPDITSVRNIQAMLRATTEGEPKQIKSGSADYRSFFRILKREPE